MAEKSVKENSNRRMTQYGSSGRGIKRALKRKCRRRKKIWCLRSKKMKERKETWKEREEKNKTKVD